MVPEVGVKDVIVGGVATNLYVPVDEAEPPAVMTFTGTTPVACASVTAVIVVGLVTV
jgi:hypothetical protein